MSLTILADARPAIWISWVFRLFAIASVALAAPVFAQQSTLAPGDLVSPAPAVTPPAVLENVPDDQAAEVADPDAVVDSAANYTPMGPEMIKGQPEAGAIDLQPQYSDIGNQAFGFHVWLVWIMAIISIFVLALLVWVILRYNRRANPKPSKTTHNTTIEVVWTVVPALILVAIAIPSISLLAAQYKTAPKDAITIKATGYQWYWGYSFPDNGDFEIISNMMPEEEARQKGFPAQLAVDNRLVVPVGVPIRMQVTAADVIHSFAVPSLWFKIDAVPGRLNERIFQVNEPGIYYGQCSELCGARHGYMPIAVEALPMEQWRAWVRAQGGTFPEEVAAEQAEETPEAAPLQDPESSEPSAPGAGAPPTSET